MAETKHILVLANSERVGGRCIAGKLATPIDGENVEIGKKWIRLNNPTGQNEGAVPYAQTLCRPKNAQIRPLDIIKVGLLDPCTNLDHPEDWNYDPNQHWEWLGAANIDCLADAADAPSSLWYDGQDDAVRAGYIRNMGPQSASLYLIKAPKQWTFEYFKKWIPNKGYDKKRRRLKMTFAGKYHDFSVTDPAFDRRFELPAAVSKWPDSPTELTVPNPGSIYFCLSLTALTPPDFVSHHYKICATFFEP